MKNWIAAIRPKTLFASVSPVILGFTLALEQGFFYPKLTCLILFTALLIQIGANLANDYFDFLKGADTPLRKGPVRVMQKGLVTAYAMRKAIFYVFSLVILCSVPLIVRGGYPIAWIAVTSVIFAVLYTGGPKPLGYRGLGDLLVLLYFGPIPVGGTYYLLTKTLSPLILLAGFIPSLFSVAILTINNLRDYETDKMAGKRTLAVRFGKKFAQIEYFLTLFAALLIPLILIAVTRKHLFSLSAYVVLPLLKPCFDAVKDNDDPERLNRALAQTSAVLFLFTLFFCTGWLP